MRKKYQAFAGWITAHREWLLFWAIFLVFLVASFGFGYFIGKDTSHAPIIIEQHNAPN